MWVILEYIIDIVNATLWRLFHLSCSESLLIFFFYCKQIFKLVRLKLQARYPCGDDSGTGLILGCLSFALYIRGLGVSHRLVQYLYKLWTVFLYPLQGVSLTLCFPLLLWAVISSARKMVNFSVGFLTSTCCGHDEWWLIS